MKKILLISILSLPFVSSCSLTGQKPSSHESSVAPSCTGASVYKANGKSYRALKQSSGYKADGTAEIYSNMLQGSQTKGCETFDLNGFTAAHRTLPLPTHIKLTNKNNGKSVVVKVNDRGPAQGNSLLKVTPAVANLLGATRSFPVHIEAITSHVLVSPNNATTLPVATRGSRIIGASKPRKYIDRSHSDRYYIVVGTYQTQEEALDRFVRVSSIGLANVAMETRQLKGRKLHMVRIGPFYEQDKIDNAKDRLRSDGLVKFNVVKN